MKPLALACLLVFALLPLAFAGPAHADPGGDAAERGSAFGFAGAPRCSGPDGGTIVRPTPAPAVAACPPAKPVRRVMRPTRTVKTTTIVRVATRRAPRVVACAPSVACDPCDVPAPCDPCTTRRDPLCTPTVFWSSGYHDGRRSCEPCDPCPPTACRPVCAPRPRVCVPVCAAPCVPLCGPVVRVGFGFPCGGFGWGWGGCGCW